MARDLGWIWLWKRKLDRKQHSMLNFTLERCVWCLPVVYCNMHWCVCVCEFEIQESPPTLTAVPRPCRLLLLPPYRYCRLCSYAELGGTLLDDLQRLEDLEAVRGYLRRMRDA